MDVNPDEVVEKLVEEAKVEVPTKEEPKFDPRGEISPEQLAEVTAAEAQGVTTFAFPVFLSMTTDEKAWYVYRTVKRREFHKLQFDLRNKIQQADGELSEGEQEVMFQDSLVSLCSITPKIDHKNIGLFDAGVIDGLFEAIMTSSGFNQQTLTFKL